MSKKHKVARGESLLSIARNYGLLPASIWNDPENSTLRSKRQHSDRLMPGDVLSIRDVETKAESRATEKRHRFIRKGGLGIVIRLEADPAQAPNREDRFVLTSADGSYSAERTVKDDLVPGDEYIDLFFSGLNKHKSYTLRVLSPGGSAPLVAFENVPYAELANLSPSSSEAAEQSLQPAEGEGSGEYEDEVEEQENGDSSEESDSDSESGESLEDLPEE